MKVDLKGGLFDMSRHGKWLYTLACCVLIANSTCLEQAIAAPRTKEKQPELDYHQPVVQPGSNRHHTRNSAATSSAETSAATAAACANPVACENQLAGAAPASWRLLEPGDAAVQGFATNQSVNVGQAVQFKIRATTAYHVDIYRAGWYGGNGARRVAQ